MAKYIYKITITAIFVMFALTGCKDSVMPYYISKGLDSTLSCYINKYPKDSVIIMDFYEIGNRTILNIQHSPFYPQKEYVDGGFIYSNKLVVYCLYAQNTMIHSLVDPVYANDKTILNHYKSWDQVDCDYDGNPNIETFLVKSQDSIVNATDADLRFKEKVSDVTGIRNYSINKLLNHRLNNNNICITAIRFASSENHDYFMINSVNVYTKKSLSGCLKRNGRIITFYGIDNLHNQNLIDINLIKHNLPLLNNYKELSSELFDNISIGGEIFKILTNGDIERIPIENMSHDKIETYYQMFGV